MKTWVHIVIPLLACVFAAGCGSSLKRDEPGGEKPQTVRLNIRVAVADAPTTRGDGSEAANDDERMRTLRILVVRPDGTVEANRFVRLTEAVLTYGYDPIEVRANERKRIYLLANEEHTHLTDEGSAVEDTWTLFDALRAGDIFPQERIEGLMIGLDGASQQLTGPLPINGCYSEWIGSEDRDVAYFIRRAAVKFTFRILVKGTQARRLTGLSIEKLASREYYLPRAEYDDMQQVTAYEVPQAGTYYRFDLAADKLPEALLTSDAPCTLDPIYLLESKYEDPDAPAGRSSYRITLGLEGHDGLLSGYLDNLPALPRNTHAVVTLTIGEGSIAGEVDVMPYGEVELEPDFGI